jgi:glutamine---fructose-6-phosphate transaminase (isomerizing)
VCGIAGFVGNDRWKETADFSWLDEIVEQLELACVSDNWHDPEVPLKDLMGRFDDLMSFGMHAELLRNSVIRAKMDRLADALKTVSQKMADLTAEQSNLLRIEELSENARDCLWQITEEVIGNVERTVRIMPQAEISSPSDRTRNYVAWAIEQVLENIDRLEVRGRDSAGISIHCAVNGMLDPYPSSNPGEDGIVGQQVYRQVQRIASPDGSLVYTFLYKVANLVGRLGDNTAALRSSVRDDAVLWAVAGLTEQISILAHTRWASNGIISLANSHPVDGTLFGREHLASLTDKEAAFVLNGDVDNYQRIVSDVVHGQGYEIDPVVTTDAKILPVFYRLGTNPSSRPEDRFANLMNGAEGSLAVVMQHPLQPGILHMAQKGSGQSLFLGLVKDGIILASEVYGLAARTRRSFGLSGTEKGGTQVTVNVSPEAPEPMLGRFLQDGLRFEIKPEPIYIHSRDIFRGSFDYYFEKEIHDAPSSVRKTIRGKYRKIGRQIEFASEADGAFSSLIQRLRDPKQPPVKRILCIGQGTASVAAMGVAHLIERSLFGSKITVGWCKASEMSGFTSDEPLKDMLVVAISQSGTTTDTNRTVDIAGSKGAWIHSIVNRRNSPLVEKSNSHFYTSDGRDVEMAVASTKAFYSQIAAGKLTSLLLASELKTMAEQEIFEEIEELERLPDEIEKVLLQGAVLKECAEKYGPSSRNWAVVGNGPNKIAADEIRIKLSELCYKSIPCDFTEDKKHIDLSTEPLTIVVANDLPQQIVQDTVKEVAIFKAHNGRPLVLATRGETRFSDHAEFVLELPPIGAGLGFVLATVAGHLWGFHAAKAIDSRAEELRKVRTVLALALEEPELRSPELVGAKLRSVIKLISQGEMNAALPASTVASLALYLSLLDGDCDGRAILRHEAEEGIVILNKAIEEMTRPIDTIRHQAKTVTVGISRPQELLPDILLTVFEQLSVSPDQLSEMDRRIMRTVSPMITEVHGALVYRMALSPDGYHVGLAGEIPWIEVAERYGSCEGKPSRYDRPHPASGSKRTVLRLERALWTSGRGGMENLVIIPLFKDQGATWDGILLFHLNFVSEASTQDKLEILRGLGSRYHELVERVQEISDTRSLVEILASVTPRDIILAPLDDLLPER